MKILNIREATAPIASEIRNAVKTGDEMIVCLGAGDITSYANSLADDLRALKG